jgi:hypothetical protein
MQCNRFANILFRLQGGSIYFLIEVLLNVEQSKNEMSIPVLGSDYNQA